MTPDRRVFLHSAAGTAALSAAAYARVPGANDRVGVGFVGYGLMGKGHVGTFAKLADADLVAVADAHRGRREECLPRLRNDATAYPDFRKLLDDKRVSAVVVSTPDHWHALHTMLACAAGKDVYVEKPLTLFVREGEWVQAVAARAKRVVQVGTQQRSGPHYRRARDLLRSGKLGRVHSVRMSAVRNVQPGFGSPADCDPPADLDWDLWLGPAPLRRYNPNRGLYHFRWFWDTAGGQTTNLGAHHLDIVDWVIGLGDLKSVASVGGRFAVADNTETPDTQDTLFAFDRWTATLSHRECSAGERPRFGLEFHGTGGRLGIDRGGFKVSADPDTPPANAVPGVKEGHPAGGPKAVEVLNPGKLRADAAEDNSGSSAEQYLAHARNFLDCVKSREAPVSDLASAHRTAVACHLANLSLRLGRQLRWDAAKQDVVDDKEASAMLVRPYRKPWDAELKALGVGP
jgi:predicted dehydrogenase